MYTYIVVVRNWYRTIWIEYEMRCTYAFALRYRVCLQAGARKVNEYKCPLWKVKGITIPMRIHTFTLDIQINIP